ncbi:hypothetical protein K493DRAFT_301317 [Basidiobolus meristosporus CBS 931.73]|uniref:Uncharacterized protein n=1 Tax=Basidiobolus meristosporus CBS 931.73 TaxID=1314790 RepID=A0A1Y1YCL0_9FUNG|nr:hypothetical protein K493DRAFT_301317 [Basidiobolus meristosporus CBS 931.73]|eukprot:ORX95717.1 hypothetical protein K493DRAFT_301317 [Basidiobolus meristosporus CBS 931.73]
MRATTIMMILALVSLQTTIAAPVPCSSCSRKYRRVRQRSSRCSDQESNCHSSDQVQPIVEVPNVQAPLLRQVFTTVTRKNDNLNTANANSDKSLNVKYQAGPSLEAEGEAIATEFAKQKGDSSSADDSSYPVVVVQPSQDVQYATPVVDTQCIEGCSGQDVQYMEPLTDASCGDNCADQLTEPM